MPLLALLAQVSWPQWRHHPWRHAAALVAVMLGVALAFSVQLINQSALGEFSAAVRSVNGEPDLALRGQRGGFDEALYARAAAQPQVQLASPVVDIETLAVRPDGRRVALRVLGLDALAAAPLSPALLPRLTAGAGRMALFDPRAVALNAAARRELGLAGPASGASAGGQATPATLLRVQTPAGLVDFRVHGDVAAGGGPLAVIDIAGAQAAFGFNGRLSRIDLRLAPGADREQVVAALRLADFAAQGVRAAAPGESAERVSNLSRAYRVNLTVLALVALFTGAFLVFSILSLSVARRQPEFALLGVLGLAARERLALVLAESALLGVAGAALGLALGTALAATALRLLAGDLGGGYFPGVRPTLHFSAVAALAYGALGVLAAMVGGLLPALAAQRLAPAAALKGLGDSGSAARAGPAAAAFGPVVLAAGVALCFAPPILGIPLAAYVAVALLLLGGIACVPAGVGLLLRFVAPPRQALWLLAVERARQQRQTATIAVAGVVAALSLAVALTVMVASFRTAITQWLDVVLPADLYVRAAAPSGGGGGGGSNAGASGIGEVVTLPSALPALAAALSGVLRVEAQRVTSVQLAPERPAVVVIARPLADPARALPLTGEPVPPAADGTPSAYVSEAMVDLYGAAPGTRLVLPLPLPLTVAGAGASAAGGAGATLWVRGVWRDYARQFGAVAIDAADYRRLTGDPRQNDLALWLAPGTDAAALRTRLQRAADAAGGPLPLEFASPGEIRTLSLRIFDRSFAVTYWLQAVAIAIGLFGIAASFSAQVLARRKEFGLLSHLGLTRRQVLAIVAAEGAVWTAAGAVLGLALGIAVSVVLVKVVNPQSFHWTMDLLLPWGRLAALAAAVVVAGTLTAWLAARHAAGRDMALAVKEDW